ncbi:MAG: FAD/NAD(P)-binding protein, partial [Firmicutes bacterium]|nr:FAD/NAD(P)-binding protein [Bacillota bacterium]
MSVFRIGIVGMGPRGLSVLERLCANIIELLPNQDVEIHVVDPYPAGAGKVWRTNQSRNLLMNTVASQITVFTDDSVECEGPKIEGPSLYEWARFLTLFDIDGNYSDEVLEEARKLQPDSYPTRAFYGYYLEWVYKRLLRTLPSNITVLSHRSRAVALDDASNGQQVVRLEKQSTPLIVDAVVLALGHSQTNLTTEVQRLHDFSKKHDLFYVTPSNPADVNLDGIKPGEPVILRGLGLNFFDYMALLTIGRGGHFVRQNGKLVYKASGHEPRMYAGSRRGVPYHARGENEKGPYGRHEPFFLTSEIINQFRERVARGEKIQFREEVWPLIAKEVETVYYTTVIRSTQCRCQAEVFQDRYRQCSWGSEKENQLLDQYGVAPTDRWSWERLAHPYKDISFSSHKEFRAWLIEYLQHDLVEAKKGNVSGPL